MQRPQRGSLEGLGGHLGVAPQHPTAHPTFLQYSQLFTALALFLFFQAGSGWIFGGKPIYLRGKLFFLEKSRRAFLQVTNSLPQPFHPIFSSSRKSLERLFHEGNLTASIFFRKKKNKIPFLNYSCPEGAFP